MQNVFYTVHQNALHITSHTSILRDLLGLTKGEYVERLSKYRFFPLLGNSLPGNMAAADGAERLIPNHFALFEKGKVRQIRFYTPKKLQKTTEEIVNEVSSLLAESMRLISLKFKRPAISLTGGCDSKTTLACANGLYDKFQIFSYVSSSEEQVDADAAKQICDAIGHEHKTYHIPANDSAYSDIEITREILNWNTGDLRRSNLNDVRKRRFFEDIDDFDVEVKSWVSEIGRAYFSKRFNGRKKFGKPTARKCTSMYKFFLHDRSLVRKTDEIFQNYLNEYFIQDRHNPIDWQEQFFWEFRVPSWNGLVITGEHKYSFDITIPYNNRRIIELLLSAPIEDRINDTVYKKIREKMNPVIDSIGVHVQNVKHTNKRAVLENIYYTLHSHFPF
jgi:hypothetical protein